MVETIHLMCGACQRDTVEYSYGILLCESSEAGG